MSLLSILGFKKCSHDKMSLSQNGGYCPDCGEYVEVHWYLVRCSCCGVKRVAIVCNENIMPQTSFCSNCGDTQYYLEELNKVNFIDINYAAAIKTTPYKNKENHSQAWVGIPVEQKLLCSL